MAPQEKALRLCQAFGKTTLFADDCNDGISLPLRVAKLCAIICVDELINEEKMWKNGEPNPDYYWQQVKAEINKL